MLKEDISLKFEDIVLPYYDGMSIANLSSSLLGHFGITPNGLLPPLNIKSFENALINSKNIILFIIDGLGYEFFKEYIKTKNVNFNLVPITSVFPSTTASAMVSLNTGTSPSQHGITGYTMYMPYQKCIYNMINYRVIYREDFTQKRFDITRGFLQYPNMHSYLINRGIKTIVFNRMGLVDTPLSNYIYSNVIGYENFPNALIAILNIINSFHDDLFAITIYTDKIDSTLHHYGFGQEVISEMDNIFYYIYELTEKLKQDVRKDTLIIITADHGHIPFYEKKVYSFLTGGVSQYLRLPPTGDPRSIFLHFDDEFYNHVKDILTRESPFKFEVKSKDEAIKLLGPVPYHKELFSRIGNMLLLPEYGASYIYPGLHEGYGVMKSGHGGLTRGEMLVPLVFSNVDEFQI
ncbi:MAG: alkaline phosphatase family protein [Thermoplasmata archaeon]